MKVLPYQPPGQCLTEPENDRRMYVPNLSTSLTRRDIFTYFCGFGDLERVCVKNGLESLNYAIVIFLRTASMQLAIAANPHSIKGHQLHCRKAAEKIPGKAIQSRKPARIIREVNPAPQTLAGKPKKQLRNIDLEESRLEHFTNLKTKLKENLMEPKKSVVPRKGDQLYVYAAAVSEGNSRWSFSLARSYTTMEEKVFLKEGLPGAAKKLLEARSQNSPNSSTKLLNFLKPTTLLKTQEHRIVSIPEPISKNPRVPRVGSLPQSSPCRQSLLSAHQNHVSISKSTPVPVCTPKQISFKSNASPAASVLLPPFNPELRKPKSKDQRGISASSYFGPDFRYEHHCYTNVVAYEKTKLYVDLEPGERERRKTIKEFVDEKYGVDIQQN
ncbi:hypothetical protein KR032_012258 [Drosophila birchii]|nr:hypothetical protein KR032_012258 [Drosophila birchii]